VPQVERSYGCQSCASQIVCWIEIWALAYWKTTTYTSMASSAGGGSAQSNEGLCLVTSRLLLTAPLSRVVVRCFQSRNQC